MNRALVSIVIPVYNGSNYLREAIDSALAQTYSPIEVLVINDGSTDQGATASIAQSYGDRIRYFEKKNGGVATALNFGIEQMRGEYFSWLSHDDLYTPDKVKRQMDALEQCGDATRIALGGYVNFTDQDGDVEPMDFLRRFTREQMETPLFAVFHRAVHGCALLIHRKHFERAGIFKPELRTTQDYELWFRMMRGQRILYTGGMDVRSRIHEMQDSRHLGWEHVCACSELWESLFESMTLQERLLLADSDYDFYTQFYDEMLNETNYDGVVRYLHRKRIEAACEEIRQKTSRADSLMKRHFPRAAQCGKMDAGTTVLIGGCPEDRAWIESLIVQKGQTKWYALSEEDEAKEETANGINRAQELADLLVYQEAKCIVLAYSDRTAETAQCCAAYGLLVVAVCGKPLIAQIQITRRIGLWLEGLRACRLVVWLDEESARMYRAAADNGLYLGTEKLCPDEPDRMLNRYAVDYDENSARKMIDQLARNSLNMEQSEENEWFVKYTKLTNDPIFRGFRLVMQIKRAIKVLKYGGLNRVIQLAQIRLNKKRREL